MPLPTHDDNVDDDADDHDDAGDADADACAEYDDAVDADWRRRSPMADTGRSSPQPTLMEFGIFNVASSPPPMAGSTVWQLWILGMIGDNLQLCGD